MILDRHRELLLAEEEAMENELSLGREKRALMATAVDEDRERDLEARLASRTASS